MFRKSIVNLRKVTLVGGDSYVMSLLTQQLKAHPIMKGIAMPEKFAMLKSDLHNLPSHCTLEYIPRNRPFVNQNLIILCPKDAEDIMQGSRWYASHCVDEYNIPPLLILCEDVNFATALASRVAKRFVPSCSASAIPRSIIGIPTFAVYRARTLTASTCRRNPYDVDVSLAIGATPSSSVPLLSVLGRHYGVPEVELQKTVRHAQQYPLTSATDDPSILHPEKSVYSALSPNSPNSLVFAGFEFIISFLRAQRGDGPASEVVFTEQFQNIEESFFTDENKAPAFLARRAIIDQPGLVKLLPYTNLSDFEKFSMEECLKSLRRDLKRANDASENLLSSE